MNKHRVSGIDSTFYAGTVDRCPEVDPNNFEQVRQAINRSCDGQTVGSPASRETFREQVQNNVAVIRSMTFVAIDTAI